MLAKAVKGSRGNRREVVGKVMDAIKRKLKTSGVEAQVHGREKHLYSIYRKMREKHLSFAQVLDVFGFRIIVNDVPACYLALGALHALYKPIPGKFKDYIAIPKANGYQSLHTTLFGPFGSPLEIQIRTQEMHKIAEAGVASHWLYKSSDTSLSELQKKTHQWLQSLLEMQSQSGDSVEFLEHLKVDLFPDEVYVFTPKGKITVAAARRDRGRLRLRRAHRHRQPLRRGQDQPGADAAAHRAEERRPRRDHHRRARQAQSAVAQLRGDRPRRARASGTS